MCILDDANITGCANLTQCSHALSTRTHRSVPAYRALLQVLQLAAHLRRAGYFVLAALTLPFDFEGRRKVEEASALVEALQDVANLVVSPARGWCVCVWGGGGRGGLAGGWRLKGWCSSFAQCSRCC